MTIQHKYSEVKYTKTSMIVWTKEPNRQQITFRIQDSLQNISSSFILYLNMSESGGWIKRKHAETKTHTELLQKHIHLADMPRLYEPL